MTKKKSEATYAEMSGELEQILDETSIGPGHPGVMDPDQPVS